MNEEGKSEKHKNVSGPKLSQLYIDVNTHAHTLTHTHWQKKWIS